MLKVSRHLAIVCAVLIFLGISAQAKRLAPKPVSPVSSREIRYSAEGDGRDEYIVAADAASGSLLWKVKVFHTQIKPWMEEDVQTVFITALKLVGNSLFVRDESARCYSVDLITKHVRKQQCGSEF